ncbi:peptidyl-prolyl cis-trans isomerase-like [Haliotis rufescens]|uniref:peptidyl-prolyl cis-trans isomerase-like n=1 Tax=Haliotis rufescens TaxID=6454 RepID=UPI001EB01C03|nr:peptidyl-prolyl cis-trans isomerase-like [Haliotis rufescens]XP_048255745.1 peptidyl-prolyl cis-trans isomerase-like [Haliotis rufescens]
MLKVHLFVAVVVTIFALSQAARHKVGRLKGVRPKEVVVTEHVYFDMVIHNNEGTEQLEGRFVVAVFGELAPMTVLNFVSLAKGYRRGKDFLTYNRTRIHRIVPDFVVQMGDVEHKQGLGGTSIYGDTFRDEEFIMSHSSSGMVSMANAGEDTNKSQFFITLQKARWLDGHHVVFGKVIAGMDIIEKIGEIKSYNTGDPKKPVMVANCGVEGLSSKYEVTLEQVDKDSQSFRKEDFAPMHEEDEDSH